MVSTRGVKFKYTEGERVLCYEPDPTKAKVLYDSKVLDLVVTRDSKGRKIPEYLVHFYGWNSSWDRCVQEDFVLSDTEENRLLQKRLAEEASVNLKGKKRLHKMGTLLKDSTHKKKCSDGTKDTGNGNSSKVGSKWQDSDSSQDDETTDDGMEDDDTDEEDDEENNPYLELVLSENLKGKLEDDYIYVTTQRKLLKLPAEQGVIDVLENYVKELGISLISPNAETANPKQHGSAHTQHMRTQNKVQLNKEMVDGLRVCFDFTLPLALLYKQEQEQFKDIISKPFVMKPRDNSHLQKLALGAVMTNYLPDTSSNRSKDKIPNPSPVPVTQTVSQPKPVEPQTLVESEQSTSATTRNHTRSARGNQSPTSGDEGQRMHRVLRSTERLRLEENQNRKQEPNPENESGPDSPTISFKQVPPGSPQLPTEVPQSSASSKGEASSASSSHSDSTVERVPSEGKELVPDSTGFLNELLNWQLLPPHLCLNENTSTSPSCVYGSHHLLRLFVKLPGYLNQMNIPKMKRSHLIKHLKAFIQYMDEKCDTLFQTSAYVDVNEAT